MRHARLFLLGLVLACTPANAAPARAGAPLLTLTAVGDTVAITASWSPGARATGYQLSATTAVTTGTWTYLPAAVGAGGHPLTVRTFTFQAVNSVADSADFTVCVRSTRGTLQAPTATCASARRWIRGPASPDTVRIDSVIGIGLLVPNGGFLALGAVDTACAVRIYSSGHAALRASDQEACSAMYAMLPPAVRAVTPSEQAREDAACFTWSSSDPAKVPVAPLGMCRAATRFDGVQITSRATRDLSQYVGATVATVDARGVVTCWQPGVVRVDGLVEGVRGDTTITITCRTPAPPLRRADG